MEYCLRTNSLTKVFGKAAAVSNVNINIVRGDVYGLIGKNGAGKSTLMKMITGMVAPTSGSLELFGSHDLTKQRKRIGCMIEQPAIYPDLSAKENLQFYNKLIGVKNDKQIAELLNLVGLSDTGKKRAGKFSLGMKQRLAIAVSLIGNPDFLVLDEPINGLDPTGIAEIRDLIVRLNTEQNITIVVSSHILGELSLISTRYGILDRGQLVEEFTSEELEERCKKNLILITDNVKKAASVIEKEFGCFHYTVKNDTTICIYEKLEESASLTKLLLNNHVNVTEISVKGQDLEAYFVERMGGAHYE